MEKEMNMGGETLQTRANSKYGASKTWKGRMREVTHFVKTLGRSK